MMRISCFILYLQIIKNKLEWNDMSPSCRDSQRVESFHAIVTLIRNVSSREFGPVEKEY